MITLQIRGGGGGRWSALTDWPLTLVRRVYPGVTSRITRSHREQVESKILCFSPNRTSFKLEGVRTITLAHWFLILFYLVVYFSTFLSFYFSSWLPAGYIFCVLNQLFYFFLGENCFILHRDILCLSCSSFALPSFLSFSLSFLSFRPFPSSSSSFFICSSLSMSLLLLM